VLTTTTTLASERAEVIRDFIAKQTVASA